jgi:hypothetical protein
MEYTDFDRDFPIRTRTLLHQVPANGDSLACTRLLAIGGTLISATGDRQFAWGTDVHIDTGARVKKGSLVDLFLDRAADEALEPTPRRHSARVDPGDLPPYWRWAPTFFELTDVRAGNPRLLRMILTRCEEAPRARPNGEGWCVKFLLRTFRNAMSHGNVWMLSGRDFPPTDERSKGEGQVVGFAFATTNPEIRPASDDEQADDLCIKCRKKRPKFDKDTQFKVRGILISPIDLRMLIEGWAEVLIKDKVGRRDAGSMLDDEPDDA